MASSRRREGGGAGGSEPLAAVGIETARLVLRPTAPRDAEAIVCHLGDAEVARWLARVPHPYALSDAHAFLDHVRLAALTGSALTLALTEKARGDDRLIGIVALHSLEHRPEFGYWLAREAWGRGLMTEAVGAVLAHVYRRLEVDEIASGAFVGNDASLAIQARYGFRKLGLSRRLCLARGGPADHVDTRLTRAAFWAALRA